MGKDYYAVLGVQRDCSAQQVRARFLELARTQHPDRFQGEAKVDAEREFQEITEAFNILSDPARRRQVDSELSAPETRANEEGPGQAAKVYLRRGIKAYREGNHADAADNFERATEESPEDARAWGYLAQACQHQRRWGARARKAAAKACQLDPMNVTYLKLAGRLFAQAEMYGKAAKYYIAARDWGGEDADVNEALDDIRSRMKKPRGGLFGG